MGKLERRLHSGTSKYSSTQAQGKQARDRRAEAVCSRCSSSGGCRQISRWPLVCVRGQEKKRPADMLAHLFRPGALAETCHKTNDTFIANVNVQAELWCGHVRLQTLFWKILPNSFKYPYNPCSWFISCQLFHLWQQHEQEQCRWCSQPHPSPVLLLALA